VEAPALPAHSVRSQLELFLRLAPERFLFALDESGTPVGFCNTVPLNRATLPALRELWPFYFERIDRPELSAYLAAAEGDASAGLLVGFVVAPPNGAVRSALLRAAILRAALSTQRLVAVTPNGEYRRLLERLHFASAGAGRAPRGSGSRPEVFVLDLSSLGFEGWIQELLGISTPATTGGRLSGALVGLVSQPAPAALQEKLSPRELELLIAVAGGLPNKQIARRLSISQNTVRNHLTTIYRKLSVPDRSQAILYAIREGLVEVG
jgi:DNA-binding CsgD family transcriptional regulator